MLRSGPPYVDVIIPIHTPSRPLRRAVESVLHGVNDGDVRVIVVCHNLNQDEVLPLLEGIDRSHLRVLTLHDGIKSPAGPFNLGLERATSPYVCIMGSDDYLEPGAMSAWVAYAIRENPDIALCRLRYQGGELLHNPLARAGRTQNLDPVKDRLYYRTAPLGLLRRAAVTANQVRFTEQVPVGKDMNASARLWSSRSRIDFMSGLPAYVIGDDASDRVTKRRRPIAESMRAVRDLAGRKWVSVLPRPERTALITKLLRIHVLGAAHRRQELVDWNEEDARALQEAAQEVFQISPRAARPLSIAERRLLDVVLSESNASALFRASCRFHERGRISNLVTRNPLWTFHREGNLVRYVLYRFDRVRTSRW